MTNKALKFSGPGRVQLFDNSMLDYFLPEICAISEMQSVPSDFTNTGLCSVFTIYLTHGLDVEYGFESEEEGRVARKDLINWLSNFWGPDSLIFAQSFDYEVAIITAVLSVTDVFTKDGRSSFSVAIKSMTYPINLIFSSELSAMVHHRNLVDAIEMYRRRRSAVDAPISVCG